MVRCLSCGGSCKPDSHGQVDLRARAVGFRPFRCNVCGQRVFQHRVKKFVGSLSGKRRSRR
jgi:DNA-directed RNA polymerase subunit N (RpoN/RPB10)